MSARPSIPEPLPHVGPVLEQDAERQRFEPHELAIVLSHYDLGVLDQIRVFARGSTRAPKVRIRARRGWFLLKRRAPGRDDPYRVAFAHSLQLHLAEQGYPVPRLIGTRDGNNSMVQLGGRIYELFEYRPGVRYDGSLKATASAGAALGALHRVLEGFSCPYEAPRSSYHAASGFDARLGRVPQAVAAREPRVDQAALERSCRSLREAYHRAAERVERAGFERWPARVIHGDWHPGNLLYSERHDGEVVAVLDFDSARLEPLMADVANAALHFSLRLPEGDESGDGGRDLDVPRLRRLMHGYAAGAGATIQRAELEVLPWLMTEALVLESVIPIAATGSFGRLSGSRFLAMVERKVEWIAPRAEALVGAVEGRG